MDKDKKAVYITKICPSCGETFECRLTRQRKYCSPECNANRNETYMDYICDECGTQIKIKKKLYEDKMNGKRQKIFCSKECANKAKQTGKDIVCDNCGKVFYRRQYHIDRQSNNNQHNFCCQQCQMEYLHKQKFEMRKCEICGQEFETSKISSQRFCSDNCQNQWQRTRIGVLNPQFKSILTPCSYCGRNHYVKPYKLNSQEHFFCSVECRQAWYANIYSQSDEFKELSREKILKQLQSGMFITDTFPQQIVDKMLSDMGVKFNREESFRFFAVDNYLPSYNLIIEVNGDYWHTNPTKFHSKITKVQYDRIGRDKAKHSYLKNQHDIEILYLWEYDIIHNEDMCKKLIETYILNNGALSNYHSFNYIVDNDILTLKDNLIIPYQEMDVEQYRNMLQVIT